MVGGKISVEKCYSSRVNAISSNWTKFKFRCILNQGRHQEIEVGFCQEQSSSLIISFKLVTTIEAGQHVLGTCHLVKSWLWRVRNGENVSELRAPTIPQPRHNKVLRKSDHVRCDVHIYTDYWAGHGILLDKAIGFHFVLYSSRSVNTMAWWSAPNSVLWQLKPNSGSSGF